jgi:hypothetical protein
MSRGNAAVSERVSERVSKMVDYSGLLGSRAVVVLLGDSLTQRGWSSDERVSEGVSAAGWAARLAEHYGRRAGE